MSGTRGALTVFGTSLALSLPALVLLVPRVKHGAALACVIFFLAGFLSGMRASSFLVALCAALPAATLPVVLILFIYSGRAPGGDFGLVFGFALVSFVAMTFFAIIGSGLGYFSGLAAAVDRREERSAFQFSHRMKLAAVAIVAGILTLTFIR